MVGILAVFYTLIGCLGGSRRDHFSQNSRKIRDVLNKVLVFISIEDSRSLIGENWSLVTMPAVRAVIGITVGSEMRRLGTGVRGLPEDRTGRSFQTGRGLSRDLSAIE